MLKISVLYRKKLIILTDKCPKTCPILFNLARSTMEFSMYVVASLVIVFITFLWLKTIINNRKQEASLRKEIEEIRKLQNTKVKRKSTGLS